MDLKEDLASTVHIHKRFGKEISVANLSNNSAFQCSIAKNVTIKEDTMKDSHKLSQLHYRESRSLPPPRNIFVMHRIDID
jgi:hypothetical protein